MPADFDREVRAILAKAGCRLDRHGGKHDIWFSPITRCKFSVPTKIKSRHTANHILKLAGLPKAF